MRFLRYLAIALLLSLICTSVAFAAFQHTRSMKTQETFSGMSVKMSTDGLPLEGSADWHEMSFTVYAPYEYANGEEHLPTWAFAFGRSNGYDSYPGDNLDDGKLHAYTLSTYAKAEAERNHQFMYIGGRETPIDIEKKRDYRVTIEHTGERRWINPVDEDHSLKRGSTAEWADGKGHWVYRWVAKLDGKTVMDCWFNSPMARIKYESNKVRVGRVKSINHFRDLRVRKTVNDYYYPMSPSTKFPLESVSGAYRTRSKPWVDVYFIMGLTNLSAKASTTKPPYGSSVTLSASLTDPVVHTGLSQPVKLYSSIDGGRTWSLESTGTTSARGNISRTVKTLRTRKYKWVSTGDKSTYYGQNSAIMTIEPQEVVKLNDVAARVPANSFVTIRASLLPKHSTDGTVVFYAQRWESGKWVQKAAGKMIVSDDNTTYRATIQMTAKGGWRFRAYHNHAGKPRTYSQYEATTVY